MREVIRMRSLGYSDDPNSPDYCALRRGEAESAFLSKDLPEAALKVIKANGGKLPYPASVLRILRVQSTVH